MAGDYGSGKGGVQSSTSTEKHPGESGTPKTGFSSSGSVEKPAKGPGPGVPGNTRKIK